MSIFGIHEKALALKTHRMGVLAKNIANADTPNFKAKDVDFKKVLNAATTASLRATHTEPLNVRVKLKKTENILQFHSIPQWTEIQ